MRFAPQNAGYITAVVGPMRCGKSLELIRLLIRAEIAGKKVIICKPALDTRTGQEVVSRQGVSLPAQIVQSTKEIEEVAKDYDVVGIDEAHLFDLDLARVADRLAEKGKWVIVAGIDLDFRRQPFASISELLARAEFVEKLQAVCQCCGGPAFFTQRLIDGRPASYSEPTILIGDHESYEVRCRACYQAGDDELA